MEFLHLLPTDCDRTKNHRLPEEHRTYTPIGAPPFLRTFPRGSEAITGSNKQESEIDTGEMSSVLPALLG